MRAIRLKDSRSVWYMVAKAASTSIKTVVAQHLGIPIGRNVHKAPISYITTDRYEDVVGYRDWWGWAFVRDPRPRLLSAFSDPKIRPKFAPAGVTKDTEWPEFVRLICAWPEDEMDEHVIPQSRVLVRDGVLLPTWVGRVENLPSEWDIVAQNCSVPGLPHLRKTQHRPWPEMFTDDLDAMVIAKYAADFERWYP